MYTGGDLMGRPTRTAGPGGWYGFIGFAATIMLVLGSFHAMAGLAALLRDDYFLVPEDQLLVATSYTAWGWTHLVLGVLVAVAGGALFMGALWARLVAVTVAAISALVNMAFLSAYPVWAALMIALDVLVIHAVATHGDFAETERD